MPETGPVRRITGAEAILEATRQAMLEDPSVYLMGEGVADPKGIFGTTLGLIEAFGPRRVIEMPVAENGLTGVAIGSALMGQRPVMVHQRVDFALLALEQLLNNAAKTAFVTNGAHKVPLTVRMIIGRGWGQGPEHSQVMDAVFAHAPGLKVALPSTPFEAKGMLIAAIRDPNPVILLEHRWAHYAQGEVPEAPYETPLIGPKRHRSGDDVTVVASAFSLFEAIEAADALARVGVGVDLFDLRVVRPLDLGEIIASTRRTGRLVIVDTGWKMFGVGAEISAQVTEAAFSHLKAAPLRLGLPDHPTPSSRGLVETFYPNTETMTLAIGQLLPQAAEAVERAAAELRAVRARAPVDQPNPAFRGPF